MRLYPCCVVVLMLLLVPTTAQAHLHRWDISPAAATADGSRLWGGRVSIGLTNPAPRIKTKRPFSWLIDVTNLKDREPSQDKTLIALLGGPRYSIGTDHHVLMLHGLAGFVDKHEGATGRTDFATTAGAAYEWVLSDTYGWGARLQVEHSFIPKSGVKGYTQFSLGAVKRFD